MKKLIVTVFVSILLCIAAFSEDENQGKCRNVEQDFQMMIDSSGIEYAVQIAVSTTDTDFTPALIKHKGIVEPVLRRIIEKPENFSSFVVGGACCKAVRIGMENILDPIQKLTLSNDIYVKKLACHSFIKICPPNRFPVVLQLMETDITDIKSPLLRFSRDRKIIDPELLEKWRDEQLEKDKNRNTKVMADWFLTKVNDAIQYAKEEDKTPDTPTVSPSQQKIYRNDATVRRIINIRSELLPYGTYRTVTQYAACL